MIRAVLDTNVLVSGFVRRHPDAPSVQLLDAWRAGTFLLIASEDILDEVSRTLSKPYFSARLTGSQIDRGPALSRRYASDHGADRGSPPDSGPSSGWLDPGVGGERRGRLPGDRR